jgi:hypothetical protein
VSEPERLFQTTQTRILKRKAPGIAPGPLLSTVHPPLERMSIFAAAFRGSHGIGAGTSVVLPVCWYFSPPTTEGNY